MDPRVGASRTPPTQPTPFPVQRLNGTFRWKPRHNVPFRWKQRPTDHSDGLRDPKSRRTTARSSDPSSTPTSTGTLQPRPHDHQHHQPHRSLTHGPLAVPPPLPRSPPPPSSVARCACVSVGEVAGHERHRGLWHKLPLPERQPAETLSLELRLFDPRGGFPGLWLLVGP